MKHISKSLNSINISTIFNFLEKSQTTKIERRKNQDEFVVLDWLAPC